MYNIHGFNKLKLREYQNYWNTDYWNRRIFFVECLLNVCKILNLSEVEFHWIAWLRLALEVCMIDHCVAALLSVSWLGENLLHLKCISIQNLDAFLDSKEWLSVFGMSMWKHANVQLSMELYLFAHISIENKYVTSDLCDLTASVCVLVKHAMQLLWRIFAGIFPDAIPNFPIWIQWGDYKFRI